MIPHSHVIVSFSGGKDSTAMLLHMIELGEHIDEVINMDTGMEFPEMYKHIEKVRQIVEDAGIKFTTLKAEKSFEHYLMDIPLKKCDRIGYGWPGVRIRWCTKNLKTKIIQDYVPKDSIHCVGLAVDEQKRLEKDTNKINRHPLVEWGWTEADALAYCKAHGFDFGGLYEKFHRVSCWICPLQRTSSLRILYSDYPQLWQKLESYDKILTDGRHNDRPFKSGHRVEYYSKKFANEMTTKNQHEEIK